jgi:hypothetical protein
VNTISAEPTAVRLKLNAPVPDFEAHVTVASKMANPAMWIRHEPHPTPAFTRVTSARTRTANMKYQVAGWYFAISKMPLRQHSKGD